MHYLDNCNCPRKKLFNSNNLIDFLKAHFINTKNYDVDFMIIKLFIKQIIFQTFHLSTVQCTVTVLQTQI